MEGTATAQDPITFNPPLRRVFQRALLAIIKETLIKNVPNATMIAKNALALLLANVLLARLDPLNLEMFVALLNSVLMENILTLLLANA